MKAGLLLVLLAAPFLTGCVSTRYQSARRDTPPATPLELRAVEPPVALALHAVIVLKGPGSWKKEAWWDEYVVTVTNQGDQPIVVEGFVLSDLHELTVVPGDEPWTLEALSRARLKHYERSGVAIYVGTSVLWAASPIVSLGAAFSGASTTAALSSAVFFGAPVFLIGTGVARHVARKDIEQEFRGRRLPLPATVLPGESRQGSLFFPVSPGPRLLSLRYQNAGAPRRLDLALPELAGLHLTLPAAQK